MDAVFLLMVRSKTRSFGTSGTIERLETSTGIPEVQEQIGIEAQAQRKA